MARQTNTDQHEIDLSDMSAKVKGYFTRVNDSFFDGILFVKRNLVAIAIIVVLGAALGFYLDSGPEKYTHKILVRPNFESAHYLYETVDEIELKIKQKDSMFLKQIGIKKPKRFTKIEIEPLVDIYNFIDEGDNEEQIDERKFQVFKLIAEAGDMKEVLNDPATSRNYENHLITITSKGRAKESDIVGPVVAYLNSNPYFKEMQKEYVNNVNLKIAANDSIIAQVDKVIEYYTDPARKAGSNLVFYNDNSQLTEGMKLKEKLVREQGRLRIDRANYTDIVKFSGIMLNEEVKGVAGGMMFLVPLVFFILFVLFMMMKAYYRSQMKKRQIVITQQ